MTHAYHLLLCFMALCCVISGPARADEAPSLFLPIPQEQPAPTADRIVVDINFPAISPTGKAPASLTIKLPDRTVTAQREGCEVRGADDYSWRGTVSGFELSTVVLTVMGRTVVGHIDFDGASYAIETINGAYLVTRKDPARRGGRSRNDTRIPGVPGKVPGNRK